jgi:hypothetical protein
LTHGQEATEVGNVVLHLWYLWKYWQLVRHPQPDVPIKSKHRSMFATLVGLGFGFMGVQGLTGPFGSLWPIKWVILVKVFSADQGLEYAHLQCLHMQS